MGEEWVARDHRPITTVRSSCAQLPQGDLLMLFLCVPWHQRAYLRNQDECIEFRHWVDKEKRQEGLGCHIKQTGSYLEGNSVFGAKKKDMICPGL